MKRSTLLLALMLPASFAFSQQPMPPNISPNQGPTNAQMPPQVRGQLSIDSQWPDQSNQPINMPIQQDPSRAQPLPSFDNDFANNQEESSPARPPVEDHQAARRAWENDPVQNIRQAGLSLGHGPSRGIAHSPRFKDRVLLKRWHHELSQIGVPDDKIKFEAQRLSKDEFSYWASRFIWLHESDHYQNSSKTHD